jgi:hypothetical protein
VAGAALALVGTLAVVPATRDARPPRLDPVGALVSAGALVALVLIRPQDALCLGMAREGRRHRIRQLATVADATQARTEMSGDRAVRPV